MACSADVAIPATRAACSQAACFRAMAHLPTDQYDSGSVVTSATLAIRQPNNSANQQLADAIPTSPRLVPLAVKALRITAWATHLLNR